MSKNNYFTKDTKQSLVTFIKTDSLEKTNYIYQAELYYPLDEMIRINIHKHKFYDTGFEIDSLVQEVHMFLLTKFRSFEYTEEDGFSMFDPNEGDAFSYCNRMIKNFLIQLQQLNQRRKNRLGFESIDEDENYYIETYFEEEPYFELDEYLVQYLEYMEQNIPEIFDKDDEQKIAHILLEFIQDPRNNFSNKKTLMAYFKNILNEKNYKLNKVLNIFKDKYFEMKEEYSDKLELEDIY